MDGKIWQTCWNEKESWFDFSHPAWIELPHNIKVEYARSYQRWYGEKIVGRNICRVEKVNGVDFVFMLIPPGKFWMGSPQNETGRYGNEKQHRVVISKGFWLAKTPVTQQQWQAVMHNNPSFFQHRGPLGEGGRNAPVENVNYEKDCPIFFALLEKAYRDMICGLPTEAQWEYACRAGTSGMSYIGNFEIANNKSVQLEEIAWYTGNSYSATHSVGEKEENPWGLCDMLGNVWEWCSDWWGDYLEDEEKGVVDPQGDKSGSNRVLRGGSWYTSANGCRAAFRSSRAPEYRNKGIGLRVSRVLPL